MAKSILAPTTKTAQRHKDVEFSQKQFPGTLSGLRQSFGIIREVHPSQLMIKGYEINGVSLANDKWIPLNHTPLEIAERFGTVRPGMKLLVNYSGADGSSANAFIIGVEDDEQYGQSTFSSNNAERGSYRIFGPGIGG